VASGIASRYGVKVTVSGDGAYSTVTPMQKGGRTVYVPEINIPSEIRKPTPEAMTLMRGYLDHEAAHVRWSDWEVVAHTGTDRYLKHMLNVIEDVRVERLMGAAFGGARQNLHDIAVLLFGGDRWKDQYKILADGRARARAASLLSLSWALYRFRSMDVPELKPGLKAASDVLDAVRPSTRPAMERALSRWLKKNGWPDSTAAALYLAEALAAAFRRSGKDAPEPLDEDGSRFEAAEKAALDALRETGMDEAEAGTYADLASYAAGQSASGASAIGDAELGEICDQVPGLGTLGQTVSGELDALDPCQGARADAGRHSYSAFLPAERALAEGVLREWTPAEVAKASGLCSGLGARLRSLLQTQARVMKGTGRTGRRLDGSVLWRAGAMDGRVFRAAARRRDVSASVLLLVDASGSMCGAEEMLSSAAVLSVLDALDQIKGVDAGACVFSEIDSRLVHSVIRMPGDRTRAASLPRPGAYGCTDVAGSMRHCASLLPPDSPRRIMLVVSDGNDSPAGIHDAERDLAGAGILVAGVGIGSDELCRGLSHSRHASSFGEIPAAVFGALQEVLLGRPA
ncbi:MAG: VWA domain-containing protein, partial [Desulfovibrio sp.]|nr:VWA domain-containing protein [Desulfovibrio sp.]